MNTPFGIRKSPSFVALDVSLRVSSTGQYSLKVSRRTMFSCKLNKGPFIRFLKYALLVHLKE
jgi:hypothetical protein